MQKKLPGLGLFLAKPIFLKKNKIKKGFQN